MSTHRRGLSMLLCCFATSSCSQYQQTARVVDGRTQLGRPVSSKSYALYARAALLEARGQLNDARDAFTRAAKSDRTSADPATRVARLHCLLGNSVAAQKWFETASDREENYAPAWRERAACALRQQRIELAARFAKRGFELAPLDFENSLALSRALHAQGDTARAFRLLVAFVAIYPRNRRARDAAARYSAATQAGSTSLHSAEFREETAASVRAPTAPATAATPPDKAAADAPVTTANIISLVMSGSGAQATRDATLLSAADPNNADAHTLLLALAALRSDSDQQQLAALRLGRGSTLPSRAALELLERTVRLLEPGVSKVQQTHF